MSDEVTVTLRYDDRYGHEPVAVQNGNTTAGGVFGFIGWGRLANTIKQTELKPNEHIDSFVIERAGLRYKIENH